MSNLLPVLDPPVTKQAFCSQPFRRIKVDPEGNVTMCCWMTHDAIGNLRTQSLEEVWRGEFARSVRQSMMAGELHSTCTSGCNYLYQPRPLRPIPWTGWPTTIEIDPPNTLCNTACAMCPRSSDDFRPHSDHLDEILPKLRPLVPHAKVIHVQGLAEPHWKGTLHRILDGLGYDDYRDQIQVATFTNGSTLDQITRTQFFERCPRSATWFSLDAATPGTFEALRKLDFKRVLSNLRAFSVERNKPDQWLGVNNNINLLNVSECARMLEIAGEMSVDLVTFNVTDRASTEIHGLTLHDEANAKNPTVVKRFRAAHKEILERAAELGVPVRFYKPLDLGLSGGEPLALSLEGEELKRGPLV